MIGKTLAGYQIVDKLGAGGMGEVYRAHDPKLGRDVALKILPESFAEDEERLARFEREARVLASLSHPNIGSIFGLEHSDGHRFLVLEIVEGEDLSERIKRGPLGSDDALAIARQVADALEAAHEQGVVHRDLKPGNIKVTPDGAVKVLDFGLAKAMAQETESEDVSESPTLLASSPTMAGVILGTAAYMSPEQARGKPVDRRADIWAFGVILFEMLAGRQLFQGETISDTLAAVLRADIDWSMLPKNLPGGVKALLERCLDRDPKQRLRDIGEARIQIQKIQAGELTDIPAPAQPQKRRPRFLTLLPWLLFIGAFILAAALSSQLENTPPPKEKLRKFVTPVSGHATRMGSLAISADGTALAYTGMRDDNRERLVVRRMDELEGVMNAAALEAVSPAFSPDGKWIVYFNASEMFRVPADGGEPRRICQTRAYENCHWWTQDEIVMSHVSEDNVRGIYRLSAAGGTPELIIEPRADKDEFEYSYPFVLPEGRGILFDARVGQRRPIMVYDTESGAIRELISDSGVQPRYASTGHLLYVDWDTGSLVAVRFDIDRLEVVGSPVTVANTAIWNGDYAISDDGTLAYLPQDVEFQGNRIDRFRPGGEVETILDSGGPWRNPNLSSDGKRLLMREVKAYCVVWIYDIERETMSRLTFQGDCHNPTWSPDDRHVVYSVEDAATRQNYVIPADGSAPARPVGGPGVDLHPWSWASDGTYFTTHQVNPGTGFDIYIQNLEGDSAQTLWLQTRFDERDPIVSPDGRWMAYTSNETGVNEVHVRPVDLSAGRYVVSVGGGELPVWSPDGKQLYYCEAEVLYRTDVRIQAGEFSASRPVKVLEGIALLDRGYYIEPDGGIIIVGHKGDASRAGELVIVLGFFEELNALVP